jgi:hypothetical protein
MKRETCDRVLTITQLAERQSGPLRGMPVWDRPTALKLQMQRGASGSRDVVGPVVNVTDTGHVRDLGCGSVRTGTWSHSQHQLQGVLNLRVSPEHIANI